MPPTPKGMTATRKWNFRLTEVLCENNVEELKETSQMADGATFALFT